MDNSFFSLIDFMITACGVYVIYIYIEMVRTRSIKQNMLMPKDLDPKKCKDVPGYINYMGKRQLAFGIISFICGLVDLYQDFIQPLSFILYMVVMVAFIVCTVFFCVGMSKAVKRFW